MRLARVPSFILVLAALTTLAEPAQARDFIIAAFKVSLPVNIVVGDQIVQRTLKEKDLVNLALGRPLGTKVDKKTEVLAFALSGDLYLASLIVANPSQNGLAQVTTTVADDATGGEYETAYLSQKNGQGHGFGSAVVRATTLGNPALNGLLASTLFGAAAVKASTKGGSAKGPITGRLSFRVTENGQTTTYSGFIVNGKGKVGGGPIGLFDDGMDPAGCGDAIIQPERGEECEFNQQQACPGHCDGCICVVCGNSRIDPGEICDGNGALGVCAQLQTGCKTDCTGCTF